LEGDAREGITSLLKEIASITGSFGCAIWRATQGARPPDQGELTMLAAWFDAQNSFLGINRVFFHDSLTGKVATVACGWALDNDLTGHENPYCRAPFFVKHQVNKAAGCRFHFLGDRLGALMIYRKIDSKGFDEDADIHRLLGISKALPFLYSGARQKASYSLLKEVGAILREARKAAEPGRTTPARQRAQVLRRVAAALAGTFHSIETSVFIEDEKQRGRFVCALTSEGPHTETIKGSSHEATLAGDFSSLCLSAKEGVRVYDTQNPHMELDRWRQRFPHFRGPSLEPTLSTAVNGFLGHPEPPPPHSLMVAPMVSEGELLGFVRCWVARTGPSYFSSDDLELLTLTADFLSQTLASWKQERRALESRERDYQALKSFAPTGRTFAQTGWTVGKKNNERDIYVAALEVVSEVMPEAAFTTIRLRRASPDRLEFYGYLISPKYGVHSETLGERLRKLTLDLPGKSLASVVVEKKALKTFRGGQLAKHPTDVSAEAGEMIVAPILVNDQVEGVLDLRTCQGERFPRQGEAVAGSISTLLALHMSREKAEDQRLKAEQQRFQTELKAESDRAKADKALRDAFEDVAHQIKSPLAEAARRVEESMEHYRQGPIQQDLVAVASLLGRAELTAKLIGLFASLAKGGQLSLHGTPHTPIDLVRLASQVCENQRFRIPAKRNIRVQSDADSFFKHAPPGLSVDNGLLTQALDNLVDNAVNYSYSNTVIQVFGGLLKRGGFYIGVANKGIPIKPNEVFLVRQRNWRGELAKSHVGEGNGLGLWIVDHIMKAHGGELQVLPTRPTDGITEVRLAFPLAS
jgi:signal transduction histidine kinase